MFGKMLLEPKYSIGKKTYDFLESCSPNSVKKSDVEWLEHMKNEITVDMLRGFNCSRKQLNDILPYCKGVVEEFLYKRVYTNLLGGQIIETEPAEDLKDFDQTIKYIVRFGRCLAPSIQVLMVCRAMASFDYEYDLNGITSLMQTGV
jgi:hypothetical protein